MDVENLDGYRLNGSVELIGPGEELDRVTK
jgi:hypothetical protein